MDVAQAIDAEAIDVTRTAVAAGSYATSGANAGKFTPGAAAPATIRATVQPASGRALMDMEESVRIEARYFIWSRVQFVIGDKITYAGENFKIIFVWPRPQDGFSKAAMGRLKP